MELQRTATQANNSGRIPGNGYNPLQSNVLKRPFDFPVNLSTDVKKRRFLKNATPWGTYHKFFILDQAGPATLAHHNTKDYEIVAIKETKSSRATQSIFTFTSDQVVSILDVYFSDETTFTVYEYMEISLRHIRSFTSLDAHEIASICKEV